MFELRDAIDVDGVPTPCSPRAMHFKTEVDTVCHTNPEAREERTEHCPLETFLGCQYEHSYRTTVLVHAKTAFMIPRLQPEIEKVN